MKNFIIVITLLCLAKNADAQTWQWATKAGGTGNDYSNEIEVDPLGNSYITGTFKDSISFGSTKLVSPGVSAVYIAKYNVIGSLLWAKIASKCSAIDVNGICLDLSGNISIVGHYFGTASFGTSIPITFTSSGSYDIYVAKYNNNGDIVWAKSFGGIGIDYTGGVSNDNNGNLYLTGDFHITSFPYSSSKIFIAKYDSLGNNSWTKTEVNYGYSHLGNGIKTDLFGNSYVTGDFFNTIKFNISDSVSAGNIESNIFIVKFDSFGNFVWGEKAGAGSGYCVGKAIDIDATGNAYITGFYRGTISFGGQNITGTSGLAYDVYIAKCNGSGNFAWVNKSIGPGNPTCISLDNFGNVFVSGNFNQPIQFGANTLTGAGNNDIFITELNQAGNFIWSTSCGGIQNDFILGATKASSTGIYLSGYFTNTIYFGASFSLTDTSNTKSDIFIAKLNNILTDISEYEVKGSFSLYPNPTKGEFSIDLSSDMAEITVFDMLGQQVLNTQTTSMTTLLKLNNSGAFIVYIKSRSGTSRQKLIVNDY
ncbi:MAG: SBBP repeat-containing protein [bacterium]|nr:SBBP repeat-containing protein [bacterium]